MKAILFDWDGTLVDSLGAYFEANRWVMDHFGLPFDEGLYRRHYAPDWRLQYRALGVPEERLPEAQELWRTRFSLRDARLLPGVDVALPALAGAGYRLGLVTATERDSAEPLIARLRLDRVLEARVFGDDLPVHKPDPAPLRLALERLGHDGPPGDVIYVGDAVPDMQMARAVGTRAVGVRSILGDPDELRSAGAETVVPSVAAWTADLLGRSALEG
ncbi:MAG TPA: HAD family hydrolase [Candidatus Limnocylindrales bacterium]|nr:HAD family hydrolase [Candidatus Limnocylindrales bacterium]